MKEVYVCTEDIHACCYTLLCLWISDGADVDTNVERFNKEQI